MIKPAWQSRTIGFNLLLLAGAMGTITTELSEIVLRTLVFGGAVGNLLLRFLTDEPISLRGE